MNILRILFSLVVWAIVSFPVGAVAEELYLIDAHSQIDHYVDRSTIVPLMDKAGIRHVILSTRGKVSPEQLTEFAAKHPDRITASVRTKSRHYADNAPKYYRLLKKQMKMPGFGAMAELIMWHAKKGDKAPEWVVAPDSEQVRAAFKGALAKGWPFIIHIEFAATNVREEFMEKMEALLQEYPDHPFALIHMGQLQADEAKRLLSKHKNLHFLTSHANPFITQTSGQPWVDLFDGGETLSAKWKALVTRYPEKFILAFDNVWVEHWGDKYVKQAALWRKALIDLPHDVAGKVAHGNAERLWKLPTLK